MIAVTCRTWLTAWALGLATLAAAQGVSTPAPTPPDATPHSASTPAAPAESASPSSEAPPAPTPTPGPTPAPFPSPTRAETPPTPAWSEWLNQWEIGSNPLAAAAGLLALMAGMATLAYRRNQRADAQARVASPPAAPATAPATAAPKDPSHTRSLQAEIMALDLELGPSGSASGYASGSGSDAASDAPFHIASHAPAPAPAAAPVTHSIDLSLQKLQWAQQLLAAGENELARVLLSSVAHSLHSQLLQQGQLTAGPRQ